MSESSCNMCERLLQLYLDGALNEIEARAAEAHLDECGYCRQHYRFERAYREYLRKTLTSERMSSELKTKLAALKTGAGSL